MCEQKNSLKGKGHGFKDTMYPQWHLKYSNYEKLDTTNVTFTFIFTSDAHGEMLPKRAPTTDEEQQRGGGRDTGRCSVSRNGLALPASRRASRRGVPRLPVYFKGVNTVMLNRDKRGEGI